MSYHLSLLKNIYKNLRSMSYHLMSCYLSLLENNSKNSRKIAHVTSHFSIETIILKMKKITSCHVTFLYWKIILKIQGNHIITHHISPLKNNSKNSRKMYYNSIRVINSKLSQHTSMPHHLMPYHLSLPKNNFENFKNKYFVN
jgi:hypothetical protein